MKSRLPQGYGGGGGGNFQQLAKQAQKMQVQLDEASEALELKEYKASAGGNAVSVVVSGKMELTSIEIKPEVVDPEDVEMLSDLIMAAVNEALREAKKDKEDTMGALSGGLNMPGLF